MTIEFNLKHFHILILLLKFQLVKKCEKEKIVCREDNEEKQKLLTEVVRKENCFGMFSL